MNVFYVDRVPGVAARDLCNQHIVKMPIECAQMLANCFSKEQLAADGVPRTQKGTVRKYSYYNHPCSKWLRESRGNMRWLVLHGLAMCEEKRVRYPGKPALFVEGFLHWCACHIHDSLVPEGDFTTPPLCMPDEYKQDDPVEAYRDFYCGEKMSFAVWPAYRTPEWAVLRATIQAMSP